MKKLRTEEVTTTSADEDNTVDESRNSIADPVVLTCLFDSCDLSDLPRFRQVSSLWNSLSVDRFRNEMTVVIRAPPSASLEADHLDNTNKGLEWEAVNNKLLELKRKPFRNFRILYMEFGSPSSQLNCSRNIRMMRKNMSQFLREFGSWIRKLELCHVQVHCVEAFKRAIFEETPNLEELRLGEIENKSGHAPDNDRNHEVTVKMQPNLKQLAVMSVSSLPITWDLLLRSFPNIHCLEANHPEVAEVADVQRHFIRISQLLQTKKQCKIIARSLGLLAWTPQDIRASIEVLQTPNLTLYKLILSPQIVDDEAWAHQVRSLFSTAFRLHGNTLESLLVFVSNQNESQRLDNFPCHPGPFNTVESLNLIGNLCRNLHFLEHFPNLQSLWLMEAGGDILANTDARRMDKLKLHKLNDVFLAMESDPYINREGMELLVKLMPNMNMFSGNLSNMSLMVLCREWRMLKGLVMREIVDGDNQNTMVDDEGMTGIVAGSDLRMPNITDLHDLESLVIEQRINVGEDSVWNGFLEVPRLRELQVELAYDTSEAAFDALAEKFPGGGITRRQSED